MEFPFIASLSFAREMTKLGNLQGMSEALQAFESAAEKAKPSLWEALKPGTGSFLSAVKDRRAIRQATHGARTEFLSAAESAGREARRSLRSGTPEQKTKALVDLSEVQRLLGRAKQHERSFLPKEGIKPQQGMASRAMYLGTGTGLGAVGALAAQRALATPTEEEQVYA